VTEVTTKRKVEEEKALEPSAKDAEKSVSIDELLNFEGRSKLDLGDLKANDLCILKPCHHRFCFDCIQTLIQKFAFMNRRTRIKVKKNGSIYSQSQSTRRQNNVPPRRSGSASSASQIQCPICRKNIKQVVRVSNNFNGEDENNAITKM